MSDRRGQGPVPTDFDPVAHPIIARHFFGVEPFGEVAAEIVADLRFRRRVQRFHRLGDRVLAEFLAEIGAERSIMTLINQKLEKYTAINTHTLEAVGGDRWWPAPVRKIRS